MARPNLSALISKFLFQEGTSDAEKLSLRAEINAEVSGAAALAKSEAINTASLDASTKATAAQTASQPLDADLTAIAALTTTTHGRALLTDANAAATCSRIGVSAPLSLTRTPTSKRAWGILDLAPVALAGNFSLGDTITIGVNTYTFVASAPSTNEVVRGATFEDSVNNFIAFAELNGAVGYEVTLVLFGAANLLCEAVAEGTSANSMALAANIAAQASWGTAFMTGGRTVQETGILGQLAITTHYSDSSNTEWGCVDVSPMAWLPRTAGVIKHANGSWYRQTLASDGTAEYELLPNQ